MASSNAINQIDTLTLNQVSKELGLDLPVFYLSFGTLSHTGVKAYIPFVAFHPTNQYSRWLFGSKTEHFITPEYNGLVKGDFGKSNVSGKTVISIIKNGIVWTTTLTIVSTLFAFILGIYLALFLSVIQNKLVIKSVKMILLFLQVLPTFIVAIFFLIASIKLNLFSTNNGLMKFAMASATLMLGMLPFIFLTMLNSIQKSFTEDYIRTAFAKGLTLKQIVWKHILPNSIYPMISILAIIFPFIVGGSAIVETIFNIPGLGAELVLAAKNDDFSVILFCTLLSGVLALIGFQLANYLYTVTDPRLKGRN
ncbi:MAG: ABC-type dipeptide/oligopeptide/nickel transport system permease component [Sphingobacteriales bacterium]|jgi:ABC-type dipeptide/oligopeptide/nickel transport system permease component